MQMSVKAERTWLMILVQIERDREWLRNPRR
jgi:hypothetical protein